MITTEEHDEASTSADLHRAVGSIDNDGEGTISVSHISELTTWISRRRRAFPFLSDVAIWPTAIAVGAILKLVFDVASAADAIFITMAAAVLAHAFLGLAVGLYRGRWRVSSFDEVAMLGAVWAGTSVVLITGNFYARTFASSNLPTSAVITGCLAAGGGLTVERFVWRRFWEARRRPDPARCKRTIVFGAGEGGDQMVRAMLADRYSEYYPVALLDDDPAKAKRELSGVKVQGNRDQLGEVVANTDAEVLLVAVASADAELISTLSSMAITLGLDLRVLPPASELVGRMTLADVRPPTVDDLLGRDPVEIDLGSVADYIQGRRVLVTGAGGSIGSELSKQIHGFAPSDLWLLDRDENALHRVQLELEGRALLDSEMLLVADIRDRERMFEIFDRYRPDVVFHAAALKHLTLLENHPAEGVKTNTLGTKNLLDAAIKVDVDRFVNVSTDKAAEPTSVLGASKLAAEKLTALAAAETGRPFVSVRFGNVLGSQGSVLPTFLRQLEKGEPLTVTHPDVTRFFMTIPEAVRLVVQAGAIGEPGELMVLDMGNPVKIVDLANQLIDSLRPGTPVEFTGLRPGEKMHEILLSDDEVGTARQHPRIVHIAAALDDPSRILAATSGLDERELRHALWPGSRLRLVSSAGGGAR